jgi:phosphotransferase system IIB component
MVVVRDEMIRQLEDCLCKLGISKKEEKIQAHRETRKPMWNAIIATRKATCQVTAGQKVEAVRDKVLRAVEDQIEETDLIKHKIP